MKILVCGGRDYSDQEKVNEVLNIMHNANPVTTIVHGDATGADTLANNWAKGAGVNVVAYPADWKTYGKSAGPIRNEKMLNEQNPDLVLAFPGGKGTEHMMKIAKEKGVFIMRVE